MVELNGGLPPDPPEDGTQDMDVDDEAAKTAFEEDTKDFTLVLPKSPTKAATAEHQNQKQRVGTTKQRTL